MWPRIARVLGYRDSEWGDWHTPDDADTRRYRALAELRTRFAPDAPVLDLGCGTGPLLAHLPADLPYLGIDVQPKAVAEGQARCRPHQRIVCGDIRETSLLQPFPYGCLVFSEVLYYQPTVHAALGLLAAYERVIAPPALFLISIWIDRARLLPKNDAVRHAVRARYAAQCCADDYISATADGGWHLLAVTVPRASPHGTTTESV